MAGRKIKIKFLCFLMILLFSGLAFGAYTVQIDVVDYDFTYRRTVTIQPLQVVGGPHGDFPMLFDSKTDAGLQADLASAAGKVESPDGYDIVFATTEEVEIFSHEIEKYDPSTGEYVAWIKIPASFPLDNGTQFYLYYGSTDITDEIPDKDSQHVTAVWSNGYAGAWHLSENPTVDSYAYDSTINSNDGTMYNMDSSNQVPGQVDGSLNFNGISEAVGIDHSSSLDINGDKITLEVWMKAASDETWHWNKLIHKVYEDGTWDPPYILYELSAATDSDPTPIFCITTAPGGSGDYTRVTSSQTITTENWYYIVGVYNGSQMEIFINSVSRGTESKSGNIYSQVTVSAIAFRGDGTTSAESFDGIIDEVRISNTDRSANWIKTCYNNQDSPGSFYSVGGPTLVELSYFRAKSLNSAVILEWATETELENEGFNLWRSEEKDGKYVRINPYFIPAEGEAGFGAEYSYTDYDVTNGVIYYYKLEDIDIYGKSTFHGSVPAIPHDIIPIWPIEKEVLPSDASLFSWSSSGSYSFRVEISSNPSFPASGTFSFPEEGWISGPSLWLTLREWEAILRKAQGSGGQLFWRIRAKSEDGREIYSDWKKFVVECPKLPEEL